MHQDPSSPLVWPPSLWTAEASLLISVLAVFGLFISQRGWLCSHRGEESPAWCSPCWGWLSRSALCSGVMARSCPLGVPMGWVSSAPECIPQKEFLQPLGSKSVRSHVLNLHLLPCSAHISSPGAVSEPAEAV